MSDKFTAGLGHAQMKNLQALEAWAKSQPKICGVPIVQALSYELIQYLNQVELGAMLQQKGQGEADHG
jgi:uncharacterized protein YqhQ